MARVRRAALLLGAALAAFGAAEGAYAAVRHAPLRSAWEAQRETGDAAASYRAYAASRRAHDQARDGGRLFGLGVLLLGLASRRRARRAQRMALFVTGLAVGALAGLDDGESGLLRLVTALAPGAGVGLLLAGVGGLLTRTADT